MPGVRHRLLEGLDKESGKKFGRRLNPMNWRVWQRHFFKQMYFVKAQTGKCSERRVGERGHVVHPDQGRLGTCASGAYEPPQI